jgi:hypothetical protein
MEGRRAVAGQGGRRGGGHTRRSKVPRPDTVAQQSPGTANEPREDATRHAACRWEGMPQLVWVTPSRSRRLEALRNSHGRAATDFFGSLHFARNPRPLLPTGGQRETSAVRPAFRMHCNRWTISRSGPLLARDRLAVLLGVPNNQNTVPRIPPLASGTVGPCGPDETTAACAASMARWCRVAALLAFGAAAFGAGCGGRTGGAPAGDGGGGTDDDGGADAGSQADAGPWSSVCPASQPAVESACSSEGLECEYGDSWWNVSCDQVVKCTKGLWVTFRPSSSTCLPQPGPNPADCPADPGVIATGSTCPSASLQCFYGQGVDCQCVASDVDGGAPTWDCKPEPGCPSSRPRLGASCSGIELCTYEICVFAEHCDNGVWQGATIGCAREP